MQTKKIFVWYDHRDEHLVRRFIVHLTPLQRQGFIDVCYDLNISPGTEWQHEIRKYLNDADIILVIISPDFLAGDHFWNYRVEFERALEKHKQGETHVIPIWLRAADYQITEFGQLQVLPRGGPPITSWSNWDEAFDEVVTEIYKLVSSNKGSSVNSMIVSFGRWWVKSLSGYSRKRP